MERRPSFLRVRSPVRRTRERLRAAAVVGAVALVVAELVALVLGFGFDFDVEPLDGRGQRLPCQLVTMLTWACDCCCVRPLGGRRCASCRSGIRVCRGPVRRQALVPRCGSVLLRLMETCVREVGMKKVQLLLALLASVVLCAVFLGSALRGSSTKQANYTLRFGDTATWPSVNLKCEIVAGSDRLTPPDLRARRPIGERARAAHSSASASATSSTKSRASSDPRVWRAPSVSIVRQNGQPVTTVVAPVSAASRARMPLILSPSSSV